MRIMKRVLTIIFVGIFTLSFSACSLFDKSEYIEKTLEAYDGGIRNPLMGFRIPFYSPENNTSDITEDYKNLVSQSQYGTLSREYMHWIDLEYNANSDFDYFLIESEKKLKDAEKLNVKITPRVILNWPNQSDEYNGLYWAEDLDDYDYSSEQFKLRLASMVYKMAKAWDNDSRIAYIEMGIFGQWGEQHSPMPNAEMQAYAAQLFNDNFKNKKIMVRYPTSNLYQNNDNFGLYWDEWGSYAQWEYWDNIKLVLTDDYKDKWKTTVFGGETTFNQAFDPNLGGGRFETFGFTSPFTAEEAFTTGTDEMVKYLGLTHTNHVDMVMTPSYSSLSEEAQKGYDTVQSFMGYKMEIGNIKYNKKTTNRQIEVELEITNKGSSPFYYDWNVGLSLLDSKTKEPVYTEVFKDVSTMDFMPGENWNIQNAEFDIKPETHKLSQTFTVPEDISKGKYILAVTMLDPAGMVPAARFANEPFVKNGYTALGYIGLERSYLFYNYKKSIDLNEDTSLRYYRNIGLYAQTLHQQITDGLSNTSYNAIQGNNNLIVELENQAEIMSIETEWNNMPEYSILVSSDGEEWQTVQNTITAKNQIGRNIVRKSNIKYVKINFENDNQQEISLNQIRIYGQ